MNYSGIIFDFNGTLFQDTAMHETVWRDYSAKLRGRPLSPEEFLQMHGRTNRYYLEYLFERKVSDEEVAYYGEEKEKIYRKMCLDMGDDLQLTPGTTDLLDYLVRNGIPHTIATASEKPNVDFYFEVFHLGKWFDYNKVVYIDGSFPGKPDPQIYRLAAQRIGLDPSSCVVVEDALSGIESAFRAGAGCIVAIGERESHPVLLTYRGVKSTIADFTEFDRSLLNCNTFLT